VTTDPTPPVDGAPVLDEGLCPHEVGQDPTECSTCLMEAAAASTPGRKYRKESKAAYDAASDWLINSRYCAEPAVQDAYWGIVDGRYSVEGAEKR
jgi:hypothetical protein